MTPNAIALTQIASYIFAVLVWLVFYMPYLVPEGFQDADGFHYGEPGE